MSSTTRCSITTQAILSTRESAEGIHTNSDVGRGSYTFEYNHLYMDTYI